MRPGADAPARDRPRLRVLVMTVVHDPEDARIQHRQIASMLAAGYEVSYAAPFTAYDRQPPAGAREVFDLPAVRGRSRLRAIRAARGVLRERGGEVDVVLLHDPDLLVAAAGLRRALGTAVVVWDVHEDTAAAVRMRPWIPRLWRPAVARAFTVVERWAERSFGLILAERSYQRRFRNRHPVVPNSVWVPQDRPPEPGDERVVYLGKVTAHRGAHELIELGRAIAPIQLHVIGPAEESMRGELGAAHARGDVVWHGFMPNDAALREIPGAMAGLSLLHDQPNYHWSEPTKVMEYMAYGIPVITTPNPASREMVESSGTGVVIPFGGVAEAATQIRRLAGAPAERRALGRRGYETARASFDWRAHAHGFLDALETFVTRSAR